MPRQKKKTAIDYGDEEAVLADVAAALEADIEECVIEEARELSGFGEGTAYRVEWGTDEYQVVENHDQAYAIAVEVVKQDLEQEPELFSKDFIERHINTDKLRDALESDELNARIDELTSEASRDPDNFWIDYEREGWDTPEEDEDGFRREQPPKKSRNSRRRKLKSAFKIRFSFSKSSTATKPPPRPLRSPASTSTQPPRTPSTRTAGSTSWRATTATRTRRRAGSCTGG
jgi:hypothetical protein